jgi:hypothetical protein
VKLVFCLLALLGAGLLAACGSGGDSTGGASTAQAPPQVSKAQFVKQVDRDCRELNAVLGTVSSSSPKTAAYIPDAYEGALTRMQSHGFPADRTGLDRFFGAGSDLVSAYQSAGAAVQSGDSLMISKTKGDVAAAKARFAKAARNYGFRFCGQAAAVSSQAP